MEAWGGAQKCIQSDLSNGGLARRASNSPNQTPGREGVARMVSTPHFQLEGCEFESPREQKRWELLGRVGMSCEGCVGAVKRVLGKMEVYSMSRSVRPGQERSSSVLIIFLTLPHVIDCTINGWNSFSVETFDIDLKEQKVIVKGNVQPDAILKTVSKTGKPTSFWEAGESVQTEAVSTT
ncbi:hypothetical protein KY284_024590 [Solanum tuberosum]|nr:hypothetical protein KY284_024590 [Solanum tuberosum]